MSILILLIVFGIAFVALQKRAERKTEENNQFIHVVAIDQIYLRKRCPESKGLIKWKSVQLYEAKYHPAEAVYTGATSGGITMGGVTVFDEFYENRKAGKAGAYYAYIEHYWANQADIRETKIECLILDDTMIRSAKSTPIVCNFLEGNKLMLTHNRKMSDAELYSWSAGNEKQKMVLMNAHRIEDALTATEMNALTRWIGGE